MIQVLLRNFVYAVLAILMSALLIFSIPLINLFIKGNMFAKKQVTKTEIAIKQVELPKERMERQRPARQPERAKPSHRSIKAGPRFAMDLGVASAGGGASVSTDLVGNVGGGSGRSGEVDSRPSARTAPSLQVPRAIREAEIDSRVTLAFCVDVSGRAYDIRVLEENPSGNGLAEAARDALSRTVFEPARKDGAALAFCGLEQPFEIRFRD